MNFRLFDGKSGSLRDGLPLLVEGNRIKAVAPGDPAAPEGAQAIDCGGRVIMPGLIDAHWHSLFAALPLSSLMTGDVGYIHLAAAATMNAAHQGPNGGKLATDVARFGDIDAENLFITCSGTHGNEGFCGSGCQIGFIKERIINARPKSVAGCCCMPSIPTAFPCPPRDRGQCGSQSQFLGLLQVAAR